MKKIIFNILLIMFLFTSCKQKIINDLSEQQSILIYSFLTENGFDISKKYNSNSWSLYVDKDQVSKALLLINNHRFLKNKDREWNFKSSLFSNNLINNLSYERTLSSEIEKTFLSTVGVIDVRLHIYYHDYENFQKNINNLESSNASILLKINNLFLLTEEDIKLLIHGATGVPLSNISVVISKLVQEKILIKGE